MKSSLYKSVRYAYRGMRYVFIHEQNFRIQTYVALVVLLCAFALHLSKSEVLAVIFLILLVLILELLNSAIEKFADILKPRLDIQVAVVKDILAAMVLLASVGAALIGGLIFWPHLIELLLATWYTMTV